MPLAITHQQARIRAAPPRGERVGLAVQRKPGIHEPGRLRRHDKAPMSTAAGDRPPCSAAINGRRRRASRTGQPETRRAPPKGAGEAGAIPVGALFAQALEDALRIPGFEIREIPLKPSRLWELLREVSRQVEEVQPR